MWPWKRFSCHIVILLLSSRWSTASRNSSNIDKEPDQVAAESVARLQNITANHSTLERPFQEVDATTIRYENANGFVPITPESDTLTAEEETIVVENRLDKNFSTEEHLSLFIREPGYPKPEEKSLENDPFYSTEARIFLSLTQPFSNRRSSDSQDSTDDFELLKINSHTPTVADYQNFYNSLTGSNQNSRNREKVNDNRETRYYEDRRNHEREKNYFDDVSGRGKKTANYNGINYGENFGPQSQRNAASNDQFFSYNRMNEHRSKNGYKEFTNTFSPVETLDYNSQKEENTQSISHTNQQQNYDNQPTNPPAARVVTHRQRHPKKKSSQSGRTPRLNAKQHSTTKAKTISDFDNILPGSQSYDDLIPRPEEPASYFEHEALFNREESNHHYEKTEESRDLSDENYEYVEVTEKPKRLRKQRRRPSHVVDSTRLPKEHRNFEGSVDIEETERPRTRFRPKIRNHKPKPNAWLESESPIGEEEVDEGGYEVPATDSEAGKQRFYNNQNKKSKGNSWANISPNVEISHSSGIEIDQVEKPKLVLPVKVNIVPVANFDHATALGNSQGFDLSNAVLQNFVTATPVNTANFHNSNVKIQQSVPEVIVGQNTFQNPVQTVLIPQQSYQTTYKFGQNVRNPFLLSNQNSYQQSSNANQNLQPVTFDSPIQTAAHNPNQNLQNYQTTNGNQIQNLQSNSQFLNPHPTPQTFANIQQNGSPSAPINNVQVNHHGLQGQNLPPGHNLYMVHGPAVTYSTTPSYLANGNVRVTEDIGKKTGSPGSNGQYLASASLAVGDQIQNQINAQNLRSQLQENFYQAFRHENLLPKTKEIAQSAELAPTLLNFYNQNDAGVQNSNQHHQVEQISQASNAIAQTYKEQNQQILKVANEIFESTLNQLKELQKNQALRASRLGNPNVQVLANGGFAKAGDSQAQYLGTKNVEILNPNIRPSLPDHMLKNTFEKSNGFGGASLTTPFPIFATTEFDTSLRVPNLSTIGPLSAHSYLGSLTERGVKDNDQKTSPTTNSKPNTPETYNPINFVPSTETLKAQKALNSKYNFHEPLLQGLNLVPLIPGGNFYKNSYFSNNDLISKPKLTSDLQKYAEEMFKESLKTIYNTQKWNNDHKAQSSDISTVTTSPKLNDDIRNVKFSALDIKPSKQILEAHFTNSGTEVGDVQSFEKLPTQTPDFTEVKQSPPVSLEPVRFYYKPNIHLTRPTISDLNHPEFNFDPDIGQVDFIHEFLTPPKPNAFVSKSPFNEPISKKRRVPKLPASDSGKSKYPGRPRRPGVVIEAAASNVAHHSSSFDTPRQEFLQSRPTSFNHEIQEFEADYQTSYSGLRGQSFPNSRYPSLTTSSPVPDDYHKPGFHNFDFNHQRTHNLMGLLRKNKRLPAGNTKYHFGKKEGIAEEGERGSQNDTERRDERNAEFPTERSKTFEGKSDLKIFEAMNTNSTRTQKSGVQ
ncbi:putative uncharacterized protein DDB_G0282133 [Neodiprion pinetum]|uniref:putative uncharacterized protein DDB_G0282133 n=1 Tax=Neodiprion pinetum TaxID=441929 RepID=UPI001EDD8004|nr:uncharacterized protein LOC124222334 [Neodiprion pinetum]